MTTPPRWEAPCDPLREQMFSARIVVSPRAAIVAARPPSRAATLHVRPIGQFIIFFIISSVDARQFIFGAYAKAVVSRCVCCGG